MTKDEGFSRKEGREEWAFQGKNVDIQNILRLIMEASEKFGARE
jgi:hypothetical protein